MLLFFVILFCFVFSVDHHCFFVFVFVFVFVFSIARETSYLYIIINIYTIIYVDKYIIVISLVTLYLFFLLILCVCFFFCVCVCVCIGRPLIAHKHCTESLPDPLGETASKQLSVFFFFLVCLYAVPCSSSLLSLYVFFVFNFSLSFSHHYCYYRNYQFLLVP